MDKKIKEYIAANKLTDDDIYKLLTADKTDAEPSGTPEVTENQSGVEKSATIEQTTVEKPGTRTPDSNEFILTEEQLGKLIASKIAEHDKEKEKEVVAKQQTSFSPVVETNKKFPLYRKLKMKY